MLDLKCNYNQFHRILGQFSLNIGIYSSTFSYHFSGFVKALFMTLNDISSSFTSTTFVMIYLISFYTSQTSYYCTKGNSSGKINKPNWLFKANKNSKPQNTKPKPSIHERSCTQTARRSTSHCNGLKCSSLEQHGTRWINRIRSSNL